MKKITALISSFLAIYSVQAQNSHKYPLYFNSVSLKLAAPVTYVGDVYRQHQQPSLYNNMIRFPSAFLNYEGRIRNKLYAEAGFSYGRKISGFSIFNDSFPYRYSDYNIYAGVVLKQKIFKNFYFTPSLDFYYSKSKYWTNGSIRENTNYFVFGPTLGFEYFISNRISINSDLLNLSWGIEHDLSSPNAIDLSRQNAFSAYKAFSIGIHYNFNWKKAEE